MLSSPFIVLIKDRMRVENKVKEETTMYVSVVANQRREDYLFATTLLPRYIILRLPIVHVRAHGYAYRGVVLPMGFSPYIMHLDAL